MRPPLPRVSGTDTLVGVSGGDLVADSTYGGIWSAQDTNALFAATYGSESDASRRGADVRIMVNGQEVDKEVARQAGRRCYARLLESGVRIFEYDRTMLHAKVLIVDDRWANVGSGNFDSRSLDVDLEINVALIDADLVDQFSGHFLEDLGLSTESDLETGSTRPAYARIGEYATELIRQSL